MRTTITIDDTLLERLRERAAREGSSISRLISDAVRLALAEPKEGKSRNRFQLVTFGRGGSGPLRDLNKTSRVFSMDDARKLRKGE